MQAFDKARTELYKAFGGNMAGSAGGGLMGAFGQSIGEGIVRAATGPGSGGFGQGGGASPTGGLGVTPGQGGAGIGTQINQTNNFAAPPPDPHTFTQQVKWQAQAVL
jgi:hypothetical protein